LVVDDTYVLKRLQGAHCPTLQYDEDIESMNEKRTQQRGNGRLRSAPDSTIFRQKDLVDDQDGRSFGTLFL
jgi:hypothetical protein